MPEGMDGGTRAQVSGQQLTPSQQAGQTSPQIWHPLEGHAGVNQEAAMNSSIPRKFSSHGNIPETMSGTSHLHLDGTWRLVTVAMTATMTALITAVIFWTLVPSEFGAPDTHYVTSAPQPRGR